MAKPTSEDLQTLISEHLKNTLPQATARIARGRLLEEAYKPLNILAISGAWDTWPWSAPLGQAHVSIPVVWFTVNVMSALMGIRPPRYTVRPNKKDYSSINTPEDKAADAETDLINKEWIDQNMDAVWMDLSKTVSLYGDGFLKYGFNKKELWTENVDLPYTVWVWYRDDNFRKIQAIAHSYVVSEATAKEMGWSGTAGANQQLMFNPKLYGLSTHDNPLGRGGIHLRRGAENYFPGIPVIEYYFKWNDKDGRLVTDSPGTHYWSLIVGGEVVQVPTPSGIDDYPYIQFQAEHVPGEKHGVGDAEPILDIQDEWNERTTLMAEALRRNVKDQWKAWGLRDITPSELPGMVRVFELGDRNSDDIQPLKFPVDNIGWKEYMEELKDDYRRITGLPPEVLGGGEVNADTSGFAVEVKYQAVINRLKPRENRSLKPGARRWAKATLKNIAKVEKVDQSLLGERQIDIDFEHVTPRDFEHVVSTMATARGAKMVSQFKAIEEIGYDPLEEQARMRMEETDPKLFPDQAQAAAQAEQIQQQVLSQGQQQNIQQQAASAAKPNFGPQDNQFANPQAGKPTPGSRQSDVVSQMAPGGGGVTPALMGGGL